MDRYVNITLGRKMLPASSRAGDYVCRWAQYTAKILAHKENAGDFGQRRRTSLKMENNVIYYMGPSPAREERDK